MTHPPVENRLPLPLRLKVLRFLAGFGSRKEFSQFSSIPLPTIESWERGINNLTAKGADRLLSSFKLRGVICHSNWLLHGIGNGPLTKAFQTAGEIMIEGLPKNTSLPLDVLSEAKHFLSNQPEGMLYYISDDTMAPFYSKGDVVGGVNQKTDYWYSCTHKDCILVKKTGHTYFRRLLPGARHGIFSATCINIHTKSFQLTDYNVLLSGCAPVVWHRRSTLHFDPL